MLAGAGMIKQVQAEQATHKAHDSQVAGHVV
jgi:hypothetical protein